MRAALTLCVRDEADIIADFLDYHLACGFDPILVHDTGSTDETLEILARYAPDIEVSRSREAGFDQQRLVTALARRAHLAHRADWIFPIDADEFVWYDGDLPDLLAAVPADRHVLQVPRVNFASVVEDGRPWYERMVYRHASSRTPFGEHLPAKVACRSRPDLLIDHGGHGVLCPDGPVAPAPDGLILLHFPLRTLTQARRKTTDGARLLTHTPGLPPQVGRTWKALAALDTVGTLPAYWRTAQLTAEAARRGVADGSLTHDDRLAATLRRRAGR